MNAILMAQRAYAPTNTSTRSDRGVEFEVIARITRRMKEAIEAEDRIALISAMHENRVLWTALAVDVADPENGLPEELRARLFYLAEFTQVHSSKVLRDEASPMALIDINAAVLRGLKQGGPVS